MKMQEYGPWSIGNVSHMRDLARILLGWAFEAADEVVKSEAGLR